MGGGGGVGGVFVCFGSGSFDFPRQRDIRGDEKLLGAGGLFAVFCVLGHRGGGFGSGLASLSFFDRQEKRGDKTLDSDHCFSRNHHRRSFYLYSNRESLTVVKRCDWG